MKSFYVEMHLNTILLTLSLQLGLSIIYWLIKRIRILGILVLSVIFL